MAVDERLVGQEGVAETRVTPETTADAFGNAGVDVFATPALVALFERAAIAALVPHLDPGQASVGSIVRITHRAPTPLGDSVRAVARVRSVEGAQVWFDLEAHDGNEPIGDGEHLRVVIDEDRFNRRVARKQAEGAPR
jgi:predicted thioesterase